MQEQAVPAMWDPHDTGMTAYALDIGTSISSLLQSESDQLLSAFSTFPDTTGGQDNIEIKDYRMEQ